MLAVYALVEEMKRMILNISIGLSLYFSTETEG